MNPVMTEGAPPHKSELLRGVPETTSITFTSLRVRRVCVFRQRSGTRRRTVAWYPAMPVIERHSSSRFRPDHRHVGQVAATTGRRPEAANSQRTPRISPGCRWPAWFLMPAAGLLTAIQPGANGSAMCEACQPG